MADPNDLKKNKPHIKEFFRWTFLPTGRYSCRVHMSGTIKWEKWHILKKFISANSVSGLKNVAKLFYATMEDVGIKRV